MSYAPRPPARGGLGAFALALAFAAPAAGQSPITFYNSNGFEPTGYAPGSLAGQQGYQSLGSSAAASVQTGRVYAGTQALQINGPSLVDTGTSYGHTNFWYKSYAWDSSQQLPTLGTPFVQVGFKVWTQNLINPGNDIPLAGVYLEGWRQGSIGIPILDQRAISPVMVNGIGGVTVFTTQALGGSTQALQTDANVLPRETWNELFAEFNFTTQTFRVYRVGQATPLTFTKTGDGTTLATPITDVPFRNSNLATNDPNYKTVSLAELGILATMGVDVGGNVFAPGNNIFIDDFWVTRSAGSITPTPEPGLALAAAGVAGLAAWRVRRRAAAAG